MPALNLSTAERREHRANAHHLDPVVMVGNDGLTPAVEKEIDLALKAHGLIKVRVFSDDREQRNTVFETLADKLGVPDLPGRIGLLTGIKGLLRELDVRVVQVVVQPRLVDLGTLDFHGTSIIRACPP